MPLSKPTYSNSYFHSYTDDHQEPFGYQYHFRILPKHTLTFRPGEMNQRPSDNKTLALPLSLSHWLYSLNRCCSIFHFRVIYCITLPQTAVKIVVHKYYGNIAVLDQILNQYSPNTKVIIANFNIVVSGSNKE